MARNKDAIPPSCGIIIITLALAVLLVLAFAFVVPVRVTVDEATLGRLALTAPRSGTAPASLAYDLSLAVALRNRNWAMAVWRTAPLVVELRFRGRTFARAGLAGAGRDRIRAEREHVYRATLAAESAPVALGRGGVTEFARESAAGVFELVLAVAGEVSYQAHLHRRSIRVTCPLKLSLSTATAPAPFSRVKCTHAG
ncbi:hypothetical protein ACP70R_012427 [Stipagrostis hirtigluma subsp. patula]